MTSFGVMLNHILIKVFKESLNLDKKKFVFEEIQQNTQLDKDIYPNTVNQPKDHKSVLVTFWLWTLMLLVMTVIVVGGMTRLTDSGLSIVEWRPLTGILPPLNKVSWLLEFEKYKSTAEFKIVNNAMTLSQFKYIYFWEWGHRQVARLVGLVWLIGFFALLVLRKIPVGWIGRLFIIGPMVAFQGAVGWWMVGSGLEEDMTDVASYRLASHLGMAFIIIGVLFWFVLSLSRDSKSLMLSRRQRHRKLFFLNNIFIVFLFVQIVLGALVAGIDGGNAYNDWPLMNGEIFPSDYFFYERILDNFILNVANVQFNHRMSGYLLLVVGCFLWIISRGSPLIMIRRVYSVVLLVLFVQLLLGILTLIHFSPQVLAISHQLVGLVLWITAIYAGFESAYPRRQKLR